MMSADFGEIVQFPSNGSTATGYLACPQAGGGPGVIVIQEWWGLVPHIKDVANRLAKEGFLALAPDLYHGETATSPDQAGKLMMSLRIDQAERELSGAADFLIGFPSSTGEKVGVVGFCMGGALSLYAATKNPRIGACVVFYGGHPNVKPDLPQLHAPVLGFYAGRDTFVTPESVEVLSEELKAHGKQATLHIYPDTDHGFFNDTRPEVYSPLRAAEAWKEMIAFFRERLV
ncbi:MAG: dienelactone hydrolase family protein [Acidobacteria bacterium]|nr:dienelactone hydrolase family protein [Acidobacteriota bacterium]